MSVITAREKALSALNSKGHGFHSLQLRQALSELVPDDLQNAQIVAEASTSGSVVGGVPAPWHSRDTVSKFDASYKALSPYQRYGASRRIGIGPVAFVSAPFITINEWVELHKTALGADLKDALLYQARMKSALADAKMDQQGKQAQNKIIREITTTAGRGAVLLAVIVGAVVAHRVSK